MRAISATFFCYLGHLGAMGLDPPIRPAGKVHDLVHVLRYLAQSAQALAFEAVATRLPKARSQPAVAFVAEVGPAGAPVRGLCYRPALANWASTSGSSRALPLQRWRDPTSRRDGYDASDGPTCVLSPGH